MQMYLQTGSFLQSLKIDVSFWQLYYVLKCFCAITERKPIQPFQCTAISTFSDINELKL
jgi:hypothetical protein